MIKIKVIWFFLIIEMEIGHLCDQLLVVVEKPRWCSSLLIGSLNGASSVPNYLVVELVRLLTGLFFAIAQDALVRLRVGR